MRRAGAGSLKHGAVENDPNNRKNGFLSYRFCFLQNLLAELLRQIAGRQEIDWHAQQLFQFHLQTAEIEQRGSRQRIGQQIEGSGALSGKSKQLWCIAPRRALRQRRTV